jgi:hypothetical protein
MADARVRERLCGLHGLEKWSSHQCYRWQQPAMIWHDDDERIVTRDVPS